MGTKKFVEYWRKRKIDWKEHYFNPDHPHRDLIVRKLAEMGFGRTTNCLLEVGCGAGANEYRIKQSFPRADVGGVDINEDAIKSAKELNPYAEKRFFIGSADHIFFSDKSSDVILTDMCLIYQGPETIKKAIQEIKRVTRNFVVLVEFHHKSFWKRLALRIKTGYYAYNYVTMLEDNGFYDVQAVKISESHWPGGQPQRDFGYIITARL